MEKCILDKKEMNFISNVYLHFVASFNLKANFLFCFLKRTSERCLAA